MITGLRIQNLRSLVDTGHISFKRLNILVGTNSSGKSTFLRTFPLLKQSIENVTAGPILWFGRHVDFGSLREAVFKGATSPEVSLAFTLSIPKRGDLAARRYSLIWHFLGQIPSDVSTIKVEMTLALSDKDVSYVSALRIEIGTHIAEVKLNADGRATSLRCNEVEIDVTEKKIQTLAGDALIPTLYRRQDAEAEAESIPYYRTDNIATDEIIKVLSEAKPHTKRDALNIANYEPSFFNTKREMLSYLRRLGTTKSWAEKIQRLSRNSEKVQRLSSLFLANMIPRILRAADNLISDLRSVSYIQPFRTSAQRYYRIQDLSVRELDPRGENFAMFFRSLSSSQQQSFRELIGKFLKVRPDVRSSRGHVELLLSEESDVKDESHEQGFNLADVGYGYSQALPIFAQVWSMLQRLNQPRERAQPILAIEQPELHLHPGAQSLLADLFASAVQETKAKKTPLITVVETHSETLINRLGRLIVKEKLSHSDVQILIFQKDHTGRTEISTATFNKEGELLNWPYGFFSPDPE